MNSQYNSPQGNGISIANAMQQNAIHHLSGPARVLAGPGSGKTFTIIQRICWLINEKSVPAQHILCLTFTKAAAREMQQRYLKINNNNINQSHDVHFGTIHSICYHIIKESGEFRQYSLISEFNKRKFWEIFLKNKGFPENDFGTLIPELLDAVSRKKNHLCYRLQEVMEEILFEELYSEYQRMLKERKLIDFDDMISSCYFILKKNHKLLLQWQHYFHYILVDEFQDVNAMQYEVIKLLAAPQNNLFVVGDDDQSIYSFRGAAPEIMNRFVEDFTNAKQLFLSENYRSGNKITIFANQIIEKSLYRIPKKSVSKQSGGEIVIHYKESRKEEERQLITDIKSLAEKELEQSAVIVRTNREVVQYTALLKKCGIQVKHIQKKSNNLFCHFIAEDFKAFLCFCMEGYERKSFIKIMNKPDLFLSEQALIDNKVNSEAIKSFYKYNQEMLQKIEQRFYHYDKAGRMSFYTAIRYFRNIIGYDRYIKEKASNMHEFEVYMKIADDLTEMMKQHKKPERCEDFFERMENNQYEYENKQKESEKTGISVITMHVAKGLEFDAVFLPDINEGVIPDKQCKNKESIEEERRLLYVAVTRAKKHLKIYYTRERGREPSRFIRDFIAHQ